MSIKLKIPMIMLAALLLNISILLCYYSFYLSGKVNTYQENMQQTVSFTAQEIITAVNGKSFDRAADYLSSYDNPKKLTFVLTDMQSGEETIWNGNLVDFIGFSQVSLLSLSGRSYVLQVKKQVALFHLGTHGVVQELLYFEITVLVVIFLIIGVIIHFRYVSSLLKLNAAMNLYKDKKQILYASSRRDEIGMLQTSFAALAMSLEEEKQMQNRIISSISHDIKTPLTSVLGYSERLLKKDLDDQKQKRYIHTIYTQSRDIEAIVEEFDDYLSLSVPRKDQFQEYKISYLSTMLEDEYRARLEEQGILLSIQNQCDSSVAVCTDLLKLRRVFANMIGNSLRHAGAEKLQIHIHFESYSNQLFITVSDNGHGVAPIDLPHIFEPFYTSDQSRHISGLGLSICKQIIEGHGGTISAYNLPEGGLQIRIALPLQ